MENNTNITNSNLCKLFKHIHYNMETNTPNAECFSDVKELFFTNFILCYRKDNKYSGKINSKCFDNCSNYFKKLVEIIEPEVIVCLGNVTYWGVLKALGYNKQKKSDSYNKIIDQGPIEHSFNEKKLVIFPMAHCGNQGTSNRNRGKSKQKDRLHYQKEDWKKIEKYIIY